MKMKYIVNARIPTEKAHGYQICKMCEEFSAVGVDVELLVPLRKNEIKKDAFEFYGIKNNFTIKKLRIFDFVQFSNLSKKWAFYLNYLLFVVALFFQKIEKNTIVYTRNIEIAWIINLRKRKVVYEAHLWSPSKSFLLKALMKKIKVVTTTSNLKKLFEEKHGSEKNILVAHDGVDLENFDIDMDKKEAREKLNLEKERKIFVYTGSFRTMGEDKGIGDILSALKKVAERRKDVLFVAVGGTKNDILCYKTKAKELGVENEARFFEKVDLRKLAIFQKAGDVMLMPFPDKEHYRFCMSPLKMFEYMASKRPIIASDLPSVREVLNEENCLFVRAGDFDDLAGKMLYVLDDNNFAFEIANKAYLDITKYTWKKRAENIIKFIKNDTN